MVNPTLRAGARRAADPSGFIAAMSRFWSISFASDYVGFSILFVGYLLIQFFMEPFHRLFFLNDLRISFPYTEVERVPLVLDFMYAFFLPVIILAVYNRVTNAPLHKHHVAILGLAIAMILAAFLTDVVKNAAGRPRPDLLARCKPAPGTPRDTPISIDVCTETRLHVLHDGWRSFPSGHSSFSFAGLGYLSLFLAGQMRIFAHGVVSSATERTEKLVRGDLLRALLCLVPLLGATMIAISRVQDYRHDVYDVCVGSLLGWIVGYWSYRRYWPQLSNSCSDEPYPSPPIFGDANGPYGPIRDEEIGEPVQTVGLELDRIPGDER